MNNQVYMAGILAAFLLAGVFAGVVPAFADDEDEGEDGALERAGEGREVEGEDSEEDGASAIGSGLPGMILYGVIAAVVGTIGYTAYKIFTSRKKASVPTRS